MHMMLALSFTAALLLGQAAADCYAHNKVEAARSEFYDGAPLVACGRNTNNCCKFNQQCGSNLLCYWNDGITISREYCADENWELGCSQACPQYENAGVALTPCGDNTFCCGYNNTDCCTTGEGFGVDPDNGAILPPQPISGSPSTFAQPLTPPSDTPTPTPSSSSSASASTSVLVLTTTISDEQQSESTGGAASATRSRGASGAASGDSDQSTSSPELTGNGDGGNGLSGGAIAGIVIGALLIVGAIVGALVWLLMRERKKRKALEGNPYPGPPKHPPAEMAHYEHNRPSELDSAGYRQ